MKVILKSELLDRMRSVNKTAELGFVKMSYVYEAIEACLTAAISREDFEKYSIDKHLSEEVDNAE